MNKGKNGVEWDYYEADIGGEKKKILEFLVDGKSYKVDVAKATERLLNMFIDLSVKGQSDDWDDMDEELKEALREKALKLAEQEDEEAAKAARHLLERMK